MIVFVDRLTKQLHIAPCSDAEDACRLWTSSSMKSSAITAFPGRSSMTVDPNSVQSFGNSSCNGWDTRLGFTAAHHSQSNGQVERDNRTIVEYLRAYVDHEGKDWTRWLWCAEFSYNHSVHSSTRLCSIRAPVRAESCHSVG
jgi:hypothetical protein